MKKIILLLLILSITVFSKDIFSKGEKSINFTLGSSYDLGKNYAVVGVHVNYFVLDNLSIGTEYKGFFGSNPNIHQVSVPVTYHLPLENLTYMPYFGTFFNHTFMGRPFEDYHTYGGRMGISIKTSPSSFMSFGWVQEFNEGRKGSKRKSYPEFMGGFSF